MLDWVSDGAPVMSRDDVPDHVLLFIERFQKKLSLLPPNGTKLSESSVKSRPLLRSTLIFELIYIAYDGVACKVVSVDKKENEEKKEVVVEEDIPSIVVLVFLVF